MQTNSASTRLEMRRRTMVRMIASVGAAIVLTGGGAAACVPPFSELQSARTLGPGRSEITPSYSVVRSSEEGDEVEQRQLAVHAGIGLSERADLRLRLERITAEADGEESSAVYVLGAGPKLGLVPDRLALYLPVGFAFGDDIDVDETFQAHPTLLGTVALTPGLDLTGSTKVLVPLSGDGGDPLLAFNLGLGIGEGRGPVVVRPEVGMLINPGEDGRFWQFSLGVSYQTGRR